MIQFLFSFSRLEFMINKEKIDVVVTGLYQNSILKRLSCSSNAVGNINKNRT